MNNKSKMNNKKAFRRIRRTARQYLQSGQSRADIYRELKMLYPAHSESTLRSVMKTLKSEVGVLGTTVFDPNLYENCRTAAAARKKLPHKDQILATMQTPMCGSCSFNCGSCGLMGGRLISSVQDLRAKEVKKVASRMINDQAVDTGTVKQVVASSLSHVEKISTLNRLAAGKLKPINLDDSKGVSDARQYGAMTGPSMLHVDKIQKPKRRKRKTDEDRLSQELPGDEKISSKVAGLQKLLQPAKVKEIQAQKSVRYSDYYDVDASGSLGDSANVVSSRTAGKKQYEQEHLLQMKTVAKKIVRASSRRLSQGKMDLETAAKVYEQLETLISHGVRLGRQDRQIMRQVAALLGSLET